MSQEILPFDHSKHNFEGIGEAEDGTRVWYARDLMLMLGYENFESFERSSINKAIGACTTLGIPVLENFQQVNRNIDGRPCRDYKLTRFACYLTAMNGDADDHRSRLPKPISLQWRRQFENRFKPLTVSNEL